MTRISYGDNIAVSITKERLMKSVYKVVKKDILVYSILTILLSIATVSYTHLDVYKRQHHNLKTYQVGIPQEEVDVQHRF